MAEHYLFAMANFLLCLVVAFIGVCRLNAMQGGVLLRVQSEYAAYVTSGLISAFQPWWGEWPRWGSIAIAAALLIGLLSSGHAWKRDTPPENATGHAPLGDAHD